MKKQLCAVMFVLFCAAGLAFAQVEATKKVVVLYDGGREFSSIRLVDHGLETTLNEGLSNRVTIFREYMDLTRLRPANYERALQDFYRSKYSTSKPDLIVTVRGRTLDFLLAPAKEIFKGVPTVATAMDERQVRERRLPANVTGLFFPLKFWPSIALAMALQPDIEQVVLVGGVSPNDRAVETLARDELRQHEGRLRFTYMTGLPMGDLLQRVGDLAPRTVLVYLLVTQDGLGQSFMPDEVLTRIAKTANAPMYILSDNNLDEGAVGGDLQSFDALGKDTAKLALRILHGESASNIPFTDSSSRIKVVDARQLRRWNIPLDRVPSDVLVTHLEPTTWETYRWWIAGGLSVIIFQSVLITALLLNRKRRRIAEHNLRMSEANTSAAILEERNRMARDMHDTLAQGFTGVIVQLEAAKQFLATGSSAESDMHINRASELARQSLGEARRSIKALRPKALENADLCAALESAMRQMTAGTGIETELRIRGRPRSLPAPIEENLLRIFLEILTNSLKHSGAKGIWAVLSFENDKIRLEMRDDGGGFDPEKGGDGLGLLGIRERMKQMNGKLTVETRIPCGTVVRVTLPNAA